ncbi:MAG: hypothetical protein AAB322_02455 [Pseudomonadota bacterium]
MIDLVTSKTALQNLFRRTPIVQLDALCRTLKTRSRMSVFRRMKPLGYFSSYTHRSRYYTLHNIPRFDAFGLWYHGDVGFCRAGTLKAAVKELVDKSEDGRTHQELQSMLHARAQHALLDHARAKRIERRALGKRNWLYLSANASRAAKQWTRRQAQKKRAAVILGPLTTAMTVEVLVQVLQSSRVIVTPEEVIRRLHHQGVSVPLEHVQWVFERYELGKKGGPDSSRSRR